MTLSIEYPPDTKACARCQSPLVWLYSHRTGRWFAVVPDAEVDVIRVHRCPQYPDDRPPPSWREERHFGPEVALAGAEMVRQVLATKDQQGGET